VERLRSDAFHTFAGLLGHPSLRLNWPWNQARDPRLLPARINSTGLNGNRSSFSRMAVTTRASYDLA
jgi:hypothetical protein